MPHKDEWQTIKAPEFVPLPAPPLSERQHLCQSSIGLRAGLHISQSMNKKRGNNESLHADGSSGSAGVMEHAELARRETPAKDGWTTEALAVISSPSFSAAGHSARETSGS